MVMEAFIYLVPITILIASMGIYALLWCIKTGQYDDLEGEKHRFLMISENSIDGPRKK